MSVAVGTGTAGFFAAVLPIRDTAKQNYHSKSIGASVKIRFMHTIRHITEGDRELLKQWIAGDPDHRGRVTPDFFIPPNPDLDARGAEEWGKKVTSCLFSDPAGPVLFARFSSAMRVDIQFNPVERGRTAMMLPQGFHWLLKQADEAHFSQVIFDSTDGRLISFCDKNFGFKLSPNEYIARLV